MRVHLIAVGRAKAGPERDLFQHYAARLAPPPALREVEERRPLPAPERTTREGELLLAALPAGATAVVLDERGRTLTSIEFAARLAKWRDAGVADLAFMIGGADGHAEAVRGRADLLLSLGPMTWPHMLVRGMLTEQLFRAQSILANHPYHRE